MDKSLLRKALADSPDPTPGYLYRDIANITFSDVATQQKLVAYLMEKLNPKSSVHILAKALKIIKMLCETGHTDFQKEMQRQSDFLKQFAQYRGTMDPKFGDAYNERVRNNAKEAIDAAFSPRKEARVQVTAGHGSTASEDHSQANRGFVTGQSVSTIPGATANSAPMPTTNKWAEHMAAKQSGQSSMASNAVKNVKDMVTSGFGLWKEGVKSDDERMREGMFAAGGDFKPVEVPTGGFGGGGFDSPASGSDGGTWKFAEQANGAGQLPTVQEARMLTPIQKEVERIVAFKNTPQRVDLSTFVDNIRAALEQAGSWDDVAEALDAKLAQAVPWQQRLNALCCVEQIVRNKCAGEFDTYFKENPEDVQRNVYVVQSSLKEKARKVMQLLDIPEKQPAATKTGGAAAGAGAGGAAATTTTGFDGNLQWGESAGAAAPAAAAGGDALDFGGMQMRGSRRGGAAARGAESGVAGGDPTKLRKRAAMTAASAWDDEPSPSAAAAPASAAPQSGGGFGGGWGDDGGASAGGGWGASSNNNNGTSNAAGGGWGADDASWGSTTGATAATSPPPPQQQQQRSNELDALFSNSPQAKQQQLQQPQQPAIPDPNRNAVTTDFLDSVIPPAAPQQQQQQQQMPTFSPRPAPSAAAASPMQAMIQQQQQMLAMLQSQMQSVMMSQADPAVKTQQMQGLMQQQQQLMQMMQMMQMQAAQQQQQQPASPLNSSGTLPAPTGASRQQQYQAGDGQFATLSEEMKRSMGF